MVRVNRYWLDNIWGHIGEGNKTNDISLVDMSKEANVKLLVEKYIKPSWDILPSKVRTRLKNTWKYALNELSDQDLKRSLDRVLAPFDTPDNVRELYRTAWDLMFNEEWKLPSTNVFEDINKFPSSPWEEESG
jgi:hypothetical protein